MERRTAAYVDGNTARPLRSEPLRREEIEKSRRIRQRPNPQRRRKAKTDKVAVFLVVITFTAVMMAGIIYLRAKFQATYLEKSVVKLKSEVVEMEKQNATAVQEMDNSLDLSAVYEKATKELGMKAPDEKQIYSYESRKSTQVRTHGKLSSE